MRTAGLSFDLKAIALLIAFSYFTTISVILHVTEISHLLVV